MDNPPVVDASPLIFLSQANLLHLLQLVSQQVLVPEVVASEIQAYGLTDVTAQALADTEWLQVVRVPLVPSMIQAWDLGPGESEVLAWAHANPETEAILDDLAGRRCATALGIPVRGTLGIVLLAKQRGEITAARPIVEQLRHAGMYLSDGVVDRALAMVGE